MEAWRPVVEAAKSWRKGLIECSGDEDQALLDAVDALSPSHRPGSEPSADSAGREGNG